MALPGGHIYFEDQFEGEVDSRIYVAHELAHVLDNRLGGALPATFVGGGPADAMLDAVGGKPQRCVLRLYCPWAYRDHIAGPEAWREGANGNVSVTENFAKTFAYAVFDRKWVPPQRLEWMDNFVKETAAQLQAQSDQPRLRAE